MGPAVLPFIKAIFIGAAAGASGAYILAVNVARIAILAVVAKLTAPKLDLTELAQAKTITIRDPIAPQTFTYGEDLVSGPLIFGNVTGAENRDLFLTVAFTGHEIDSIQKYRIDDTDVLLSEVSGSEDGDVTGGKFSGVARVDVRKGTTTQVAIPNLTSSFSSLFNSAHRGRGWSYMNWEFNLIEGQEDVFKTQPVNLRSLIRGYKVYDPRLDDTNGGTGPHRLADPTTWEWSGNPALCLAHFLLDDKFGMKEEDDRIDWPLVIIAADICEELVAIPTAATQDRYTCNVTFSAAQLRREVRDELVNSMLGRLVFSQGLWKMWAGAALTSDVNLDEANLAGSITLQATTGSRERYNRVRGKFIDKDRDWVAATYPEARSSTYVTQDGNEVRPAVVDFMSTNDFFEAQRKSIATLDMSRNQRVVVFEGNMSVFRIQGGSVVTLDIAEWGFAGEKFFVTEWKFTDIGINLTLVEEVDTVWDEPAEGAYTERSATGVLTFGETGVPAPSTPTATAIVSGITLNWTNPLANTFNHIEIHGSDTNVRGNAVLIGTTGGESFTESLPGQIRTRYYWLRAVNAFGEVSAFAPDLTTTTATTSSLADQNPNLIHDPDFDISIAIGGTGLYWDTKVDAGGQATFGANGVDGSNSVTIDTDIGATDNTQLFSKRLFRANTPAIDIFVRYQTPSGSDYTGVNILLEGFDTEAGDTEVGQVEWPAPAQTGSLPGTSGAFSTFRIHLDTSSVIDARYWRFTLGVTQNINDIIIDSVFTYAGSEAFGSQTLNTKHEAGLVPESDTVADVGKVLKSDGGWANNPGGQTDAPYIFDNATGAADPGSGQIRFNNATLASITALYISATDALGVDSDPLLGFLADGNRIYYEVVGDPSKAALFEISSAPTDNTGWWTIPVTVVVSDTIPVDADELSVIVHFNVDAAAGGGDVSASGTPVNNQLAIWTNANTIEGVTGLTYDGTILRASRLTIFSNSVATITDILLTDNGNIGATAGMNFIIDTDDDATTLSFQWGHNAPGLTNLDLLMELEEEGRLTIFSQGDSNANLNLQRFSATGRAQITLKDELGANLWRIGTTAAGGSDFAFFDGTLNILLLTNAGVDIIGALTATSYGGIAEANLLSKTATETISGAWTHTNILGIQSAAPELRWRETGATADEGRWDLRANNDTWIARAVADDFGSADTIFTVNRTGINVDNFTFSCPILATSYDGVLAANLLDKAASETISGNYTFGGGNVQNAGSFTFTDNIDLRFGNSIDAIMYFSSVDLFIDMDAGIDFRLRGGSTGLEEMITALADGAVQLFFNNTNELQTQGHNATDNITGAEVRHFDGNFYDVGLARMPKVNFTANTAISDTHWHKRLVHNGTADASLNLTYNTEVSQPQDVVMWVQAKNGPVVLVDGTMVLHLYDGASTPVGGNITIARGGWATIVKDTDSLAHVTGVGLTQA